MLIGDTSGVLHIGPGQHIHVNNLPKSELLVNIYVYEDGMLTLPPNIECRGVSLYIM